MHRTATLAGLLALALLPSFAQASLVTGEDFNAQWLTPRELAIDGTFAYIVGTGCGDSLKVMDLSTLTAPTLVGGWGATEIPAHNGLGLAILGTHAYVQVAQSIPSGGTEFRLYALDISTPSAPSLVSSIATGSGLTQITAAGSHVYGVSTAGCLEVYDVSTPASMSVASVICNLDAPVVDVAIDATALYAISAGVLYVFDVTDPTAPTIERQFASFFGGRKVATSANRLFYTAAGGNLFVYDRTSPLAPAFMGFKFLDGFSMAPVSDSVVWVTDDDEPKVYQVDVSDPAAIVTTETVTTRNLVQLVRLLGAARVVTQTGTFVAVIEDSGTPSTPPGGWVSPGPESCDGDGDGVGNDADNCTEVSNASQLDSDGDSYGNACDADLNDDLSTDLTDFGLFSTAYQFGTIPPADPDADMNGDGLINLGDFGLFGDEWGTPPGPSCCAP